jgi:hypothetical protein
METRNKPNRKQVQPPTVREEDFPIQEQTAYPKALLVERPAVESFSERLAEAAQSINSPVLLP